MFYINEMKKKREILYESAQVTKRAAKTARHRSQQKVLSELSSKKSLACSFLLGMASTTETTNRHVLSNIVNTLLTTLKSELAIQLVDIAQQNFSQDDKTTK
ncbi:hypothetical protein OAP63_10685 [Vibrio sp.]|uniref:Uncharacterized protein n=1 Tax=Vibrio viridaestus TaxID=2487322 RepID=A0A3N9TBA8_9VIBR|nr:hypothetical protein [Vibrio viridaestus]MDC0611195.1 hypothetical protein [Vibrio sp.]RQW61458.1 hypothetical protein EES38_19145 [Vibrio viridaestus]